MSLNKSDNAHPPSDKEIVLLQKKRLEQLQSFSPTNILVKAREGGIPEGTEYADNKLYWWVPWEWLLNVKGEPVITNPLYTRGILLNELVFDPDTKNWSVLYQEMSKLINWFIKNHVPHELGYSGGDGCHAHVWFDYNILIQSLEVKAIFDEAKKLDIDLYKVVRNALINVIFIQSGANRDALQIDSKKINFRVHLAGSQIREYGTKRPGGNFKTLITSIPEEKPIVGSLPLVFPAKRPDLWNWSEYIPDVIVALENAVKKAETSHEYDFTEFNLMGTDLKNFPCINALMKGGRRSGRYYGAVSIALMSKKVGHSWTLTKADIMKYLKKCDGLDEDGRRLRCDNTKSAFEDANTHFSCTTIKETFGNEYCKFLECAVCKEWIRSIPAADEQEDEPVNQELLSKAEEILQTGNPIEYLRNVFKSLHVGDDEIGDLGIKSIGSQSVRNTKGIQPKPSGDVGGGKTHAMKTIVHMVPKKYKITTSLSDKAIYYMKILPGSIIFSDDATFTEGLEGAIKRSMTNFQEGDVQTIVDKLEQRTLSIPPRIVWFFTSVDDSMSEQLFSRMVGVGVEDSIEHHNKINEFQLQQAQSGIEDFPVTEEVIVARYIIKKLKEQLFNVVIPFACDIEWKDVKSHRNLGIFLDFIKASCVYFFEQRKKDDAGRLIAEMQDLHEALLLYKKLAPSQTLKLNKTEQCIVQYISSVDEANRAQICQVAKIKEARLSQIMGGRDGKAGLLDRVQGLHVHKIADKYGDGEEATGESRTFYKDIFTMSEPYNPWINFENVLELKNDTLLLYRQFTTTLLDKVKCNTEDSNNNNKNNNEYFTDNDSIRGERNPPVTYASSESNNLSLSQKTVKIGKVVKSSSPDSESASVKCGKESIKCGIKSPKNKGAAPQNKSSVKSSRTEFKRSKDAQNNTKTESLTRVESMGLLDKVTKALKQWEESVNSCKQLESNPEDKHKFLSWYQTWAEDKETPASEIWSHVERIKSFTPVEVVRSKTIGIDGKELQVIVDKDLVADE